MKLSLSPTHSYTQLIKTIWDLLHQARSFVVQHVNTTLIKTYRTIWKQIVEHEQWWERRAKYGSWLLKKLSQDLTKQFGRWFSPDNLQYMRLFYVLYSNYETVSRNSWKLNWSHYLYLMRIDDKDERNFYLIECVSNKRSVRELKRQFNSALYERLSLSKNKKKVEKLAQKWQILETAEDLIKDPYILEFLGLKAESEYTESELEQAIISNLSGFLLELGKWFSFVGRQQRITDGPNHRYVDLVFYNRLLHCFVLIDLKIGELAHQDIGQMMMYVNRYDREIKKPEEHPTIWLVLCKKKNRFVAEYTLPKGNKQIFAREYKLYLPDKKILERYLEKKLL